MGFWARILEWVTVSSLKDLPDPGIKPTSLCLLHWQVDPDHLPVPPGKPIHSARYADRQIPKSKDFFFPIYPLDIIRSCTSYAWKLSTWCIQSNVSCYIAESLHYLKNLSTTHWVVYVSWQMASDFFLFFFFFSLLTYTIKVFLE